MKKLILNEKELRKRMIDLDIKTINELSVNSGVSKPTIYEYLNGKSPLSAAFARLCDYLCVDPQDILKEAKEDLTEESYVQTSN